MGFWVLAYHFFERIESFGLLPTVAEFKKQPVGHKFY
jgi:hypothetical protein